MISDQRMKTIEAVEKEIIKEFAHLPDIESKYEYLFELGGDLPEMDPSLKNEKNLVRGCQSQLWFQLSIEDGKLQLQVDSDSLVMKGIGALMVRLIDDRQPQEIQNLNLDFIDKLNIWKLPSNRNNGLLSMMSHLHRQAGQLSMDK